MKEPMQRIVEAAGECWHKYGALSLTNEHGLMCEHCSAIDGVNTSPTDLNELFRLAKELGIKGVGIDFIKGIHGTDDFYTVGIYKGSASGTTIAEALLNALDQAIQEVSDE